VQIGLGISPTIPMGVAVPAFTPASISGLQLWLDASDSSTLYQNSNGTTAATADGDPVGYWADKSGNGRHATQSDGTKRPTLKLNIQNGKPVIRYDGTNDFSQLASTLASNTNHTIFFVYKCPNPPMLGLTNLNFLAPYSTGPYANLFYINNGAGYFEYSDIVNGSQANVRIQSLVWSSSMPVLYFNGIQIAQNRNGTQSGTTFYDAIEGNYTRPRYGGADILEIVFYSSDFSDANRILVQNYLNTKWSVY